MWAMRLIICLITWLHLHFISQYRRKCSTNKNEMEQTDYCINANLCISLGSKREDWHNLTASTLSTKCAIAKTALNSFYWKFWLFSYKWFNSDFNFHFYFFNAFSFSQNKLCGRWFAAALTWLFSCFAYVSFWFIVELNGLVLICQCFNPNI